ncbi:hypothetical protein [Streptomyces sp. B15]|uniref:hypothetical protein n=1 Tax=Streptomyces sp. B15 TaxID=1537797 RepID=UPI001B3848CC|nr:hypothetical protein [Streptomyces sp. B15]MBQ1121074.1 hypothetical protein [Streptomyces sp. B15]
MPGDEVHEGEGARTDAAPGARGRTGPRHAAPRKPLLTRFHLPAGKAIALAAMPSAVLMGVGLTPQLANAKPLPKNPFKGDSCVSISEQQETEKEKQERKERAAKLKEDLAREQAKREKAAKEAAEKAGKGADDAKEKAEGGASGEKPGDTTPSERSSGSSGSAKPAPSPSPSTGSDDGSAGSQDDEENPWYDPLGVGKTLDGVLDPDKDKDEPADEPSATPSPSTGSGSDSGSGDGDKSSAPSGGSDSGSRKSGGGEPKAGSPEAGSDSRSAKKDDKPGTSAEDSEDGKSDKGDKGGKDSEGPGADKKDGTARDYDPAKDAGKPFPCPEKMSVEGKDEQTPAQIPYDPWYLEASSLTLKGLDYEGVVNIKMPNGKTKQALKFTADALDIGDLHQTVKADGVTYHVQAAEGSTSTIRGGKVTMYTEELKGNLFGLIPITFSPETPPPINVPFAYFTDVSVTQAGQFGGTLTVPGLHQYVSK